MTAAGVERVDGSDHDPPAADGPAIRARLGVVLIRLFEAEDEMPLQVVVDTSRSMDFGEKFPVAQQLAAMVSYLALISGERIRLATVPEPGRLSIVSVPPCASTRSLM